MAIQELNIEQYQELFENGESEYTLVDVREIDEYQKVRVPNAVNIPLSEFQVRFKEIANDKPLILICQTGVRSLMAAQFMNTNGYEDIYNFTEGTLGWMRRGLPLNQG
jgi:rhodanese-related sulfurtransferase